MNLSGIGTGKYVVRVWDRGFSSRIYGNVSTALSGGFQLASVLPFVYAGFISNAIPQAFMIREKF